MANRLKEFRKENKITQNKLSELLKTSQSTIADYERGKNYLPTPPFYIPFPKNTAFLPIIF